MKAVTCKAPVNLAAIKYWGKRDEVLILPLNDSISVTFSCEMMHAKTTVAASPNFTKDRMWLNGREEISFNSRLQNCLRKLREIASKDENPNVQSILPWKIHIVSENNFPTAAGLASSAAGYACLVYALAQLYQIRGDLSHLARQGSGSACRSLYGGFVIWKMGLQEDGSDSLAKQIAPASHWPQLKVLVLVVNWGSKAVSSTIAMQRSVQTSEYLRIASGAVVEKRVNELTEAILKRDFPSFAVITMKESNRLHSICLDTYPPVHYMNETSHFIVQMVHLINNYFGEPRVAYTFDAGPNACLFLEESNVPLVLSLINHFLPPSETNNGKPYFRGRKVPEVMPQPEIIQAIPLTPCPAGSLKNIMYVDVGEGPEVLSQSEHLIDDDGLPKNLK